MFYVLGISSMGNKFKVVRIEFKLLQFMQGLKMWLQIRESNSLLSGYEPDVIPYRPSAICLCLSAKAKACQN